MRALFLDTSALVKLYVDEAGSAQVAGLVGDARDVEVVICAIAEVEFGSALFRKLRAKQIAANDANLVWTYFREDCATRFRIRAVDSAVIATATRLVRQHPLRAYDALQLSTCLEVNDARLERDLVAAAFVCSDAQLVEVARAEGVESIDVKGR